MHPDESISSPLSLTQLEYLLDQRWPETKIDPSLERMRMLMDLLANPQCSYPCIHIAGTNGKTSIARMIDALLRALQCRTGRTISPHLQSVTERISIDGVPLTPEHYLHAYEDIAAYIQLVDQHSQAHGGPLMSKFEVLTAMAFAAFADAPIDVGVIETGMGGRWDATNIVDAPVSVLTPISIDHCDYLGADLASIATEKAGIIPPSSCDYPTTVIVAKQDQSAISPIEEYAHHQGATLLGYGRDFSLGHRVGAVGGQMLTLQGIGGEYPEIFLPLYGAHQAHNAAVALAAVEAFFGASPTRPLDHEAIQQGFALATSPGRLERLQQFPPLFIDAAHNPSGAHALAHSLAHDLPFTHWIGVVSIFADKDATGILQALEPVCERLIVTTNGSPRAYEPHELFELACGEFGTSRVQIASTLEQALNDANEIITIDSEQSHSGASSPAIIVTGSVATAGQVRSLLGYEPC